MFSRIMCLMSCCYVCSLVGAEEESRNEWQKYPEFVAKLKDSKKDNIHEAIDLNALRELGQEVLGSRTQLAPDDPQDKILWLLLNILYMNHCIALQCNEHSPEPMSSVAIIGEIPEAEIVAHQPAKPYTTKENEECVIKQSDLKRVLKTHIFMMTLAVSDYSPSERENILLPLLKSFLSPCQEKNDYLRSFEISASPQK